MTDSIDPVDVWREAFRAGRRYYALVGRQAARWMRTFLPALARNPGREDRPVAPSALPTPIRGTPVKTMVVEAEAGGRGVGVFVVENSSANPVSASASVSSFSDPSGRQVHPAVRFRPAALRLEPGQQVLVQVAAAVDDTMDPDVSYRGEITIPGLSHARIPIVIRRRPGPKVAATRAASRRSRSSPSKKSTTSRS